MSPLWRVLCVIFVVESHQKEAMRSFILHQSNPPCRDVDTNKERKPCTLTNQYDYQRLMLANTRYPAPQCQLNILCKDGTTNMTCLPLSLTPVSYFCACNAEKGDLNTRIGWKNLVYLLKLHAPLDSQINVSSIFSADFWKENIRFDYKGQSCAWFKHDSDTSPWVKFDFLQSRTAIGVKIEKRCEDPYTNQYVTSLHVSTSEDDVTWSYIGTDVQVVYEGMVFTWWFDRDVSARYGRIKPVTFNIRPSMRVDFIGYW